LGVGTQTEQPETVIVMPPMRGLRRGGHMLRNPLAALDVALQRPP
jgi:hypothetical protein